MSKRITILFPESGNKPIGGYKVMLQYANEFAKLEYEVNVVYSCYYDIPIHILHKTLRFCKLSLRFIATKYFRGFSCKKWFDLNPTINEYYVWSLYSSRIPEADYYFATAAVTAKSLTRFNISPANKFYFIQSYENWHIGEKGLFETYRLDCQKIAVSQWLKDIVDLYSPYPSFYIPNGFDGRDYFLSKPIEERNPHMVSILYHEWIDKGFKIGFEALQIVQETIPDLTVLSFGVYKKPTYFPDWFKYYQNPDKEMHNRINNEAAIYLGTSSMEGYGLTIGEAMMCGQAVVCTDNKGYLEMAEPDVNALVCPVGDYQALANAIIRLIKDNNLRISLAKKGNQSIQKYTIEKSFLKLLSLLNVE